MSYLATLHGYHHYFTDRNWTGTLLAISLLLLAFEIWMIVDVINSRRVPKGHKVWWVVGMFLIHPFVAIIYYVVTRWTDTYKK